MKENFAQRLERFYDNKRPNKYKLKSFLIKDGKLHRFALICPGGGYEFVSSCNEGTPIAKELNKRGYHAFVLFYHIKNQYPIPHNDLQRALNYILSIADKQNIIVDNWSLWGSSAGGHLVASFCTQNNQLPNPSALILSYPVITMGEFTHKGSLYNLLGQNPDPALIEKLSVERNISQSFPPTFVWCGKNDRVVNSINTKMLVSALESVKVPCKAFEFDGVGHGVGLAKGTPAVNWFNNAVLFWEEQQKNYSV